MSRVLSTSAALGLSLSLAACPFSNRELDTLPFYCTGNQDCAGDAVCGTRPDDKYPRCVDRADFCTSEDWEPGLGETDYNCGGPCAKCDDSLTCLVDADCQSGTCGPFGGELRCVPPPSLRRGDDGAFKPPACDCVGETIPCWMPACMLLEVCDGAFCRPGCIHNSDCPYPGTVCDTAKGACIPSEPCPAGETGFFCAVPPDATNPAPRWGFTVCGGAVTCEPLQD